MESIADRRSSRCGYANGAPKLPATTTPGHIGRLIFSYSRIFSLSVAALFTFCGIRQFFVGRFFSRRHTNRVSIAPPQIGRFERKSATEPRQTARNAASIGPPGANVYQTTALRRFCPSNVSIRPPGYTSIAHRSGMANACGERATATLMQNAYGQNAVFHGANARLLRHQHAFCG